MKNTKISKKVLIICQLLSIIIITFLIIICDFFISYNTIFSKIIIFILRTLLVFVPIIYLPIAYDNTKYYISDKKIIYKRGVFIKKESIIITDNITIITLFSLPLIRTLKISSILINTAGGNLIIHFLDTPNAVKIFNFLSNNPKEG